jgi:hypothetical protein
MKSIKKVLLRTLLRLFITLVSFIGLFVVPYFANIVMPWQRADAIEAALEWGDLAALPDNAGDIPVGTEGSMITREFIIKFTGEKEAIRNWILQSEGLKDAAVHKEDNGVAICQVSGGEGAIWRDSNDGRKNGGMIIDVSWS